MCSTHTALTITLICIIIILFSIRIDKVGPNTYDIQFGLLPLYKRRKDKKHD